jgi:hypothetical protein
MNKVYLLHKYCLKGLRRLSCEMEWNSGRFHDTIGTATGATYNLELLA